MNALKNELEREHYIVLTFNAWTNDFETEPLIPLVQEITSQIIKNVNIVKTKETLKKTGLYLLATVNELIRLTSKTTISIVNGESKIEIPEIDIINDSVARIENTVEKLNDNKNIEKKLNAKSDLAEMINYFKSKLIEMHGNIYEKSKSPKKIIILIDELDRCRPTFAIELLERVKHFFDTGKYLFVFTINSK